MSTTEPLFDPLEAVLISDELLSITALIQTCVLVLTTFSFSLLIYTVGYCSPKTVGNYKWFVFFAIFCVLPIDRF